MVSKKSRRNRRKARKKIKEAEAGLYNFVYGHEDGDLDDADVQKAIQRFFSQGARGDVPPYVGFPCAAIHAACDKGRLQCLKVLLANGANVDAQDGNGKPHCTMRCILKSATRLYCQHCSSLVLIWKYWNFN